MQTIYLHTGTNLGHREHNLRMASMLIRGNIGRETKASSWYITEPWGKTRQPQFLNQALEVQTHLTPQQVLETIHKIEKHMGRKKSDKWSARVIDIDILFFGDLIIETKRLTLPHKLLHLRNFVLNPMLEIAPDLVHPVLKKTIRELVEESEDPLKAVKF